MDYSGFLIIEEFNGDIPCLRFFILDEKEWRICKPWHRNLIVKLLRRGIGYKALESKLHQFQAKDGIPNIIDLSNNFYLVKFNNYLDYEYALTGGLCLIYDHYLTIQPWDPTFNLEKNEIKKVIAWVRLLGLSIKLYDENFLPFGVNKIGRMLKVNATIKT